MFDRIVLKPHTREVVREYTKNVYEHRAPTDESVKLLAEAEAEAQARERVIEDVHVGDTTFECVVHIEKTMFDQAIHLIAIFSLNGKKLSAMHSTHEDDYDRPTALAALRDAVAKRIAEHILTSALQNLHTHSSFALFGSKFK